MYNPYSKAVGCQWVCLCVCSFVNSTETDNLNELTFFGMIPVESLHKYKVGIYIMFCHMLRAKIFEINEEIRMGGQICPPPVCLGLSIAGGGNL